MADTFGGSLGDTLTGGGNNTDGNRREREPKFIPVTEIPAGVAAAGIESDQITGWLHQHLNFLPVTDQVITVIDHMSGYSAVAAGLTVAALGADSVRWFGFRHRRAITRQVRSATYLTPKWVWVPWPPGIAAPRRVIVKLQPGDVIRDTHYELLVDALNKYANRYMGRRLARKFLRAHVWDMQADWQAGSSRLVITRRDPHDALKQFSDQHKRLAALLDEKFPLPEARISAVDRDDAGVEIGYAITYKPVLAAALPSFQQRLREALVGTLPPHESGRDWTVSVQSEHDLVRIGLAEPLPRGAVPHTPLPLSQYQRMSGDELGRIPFAVGAEGQQAYWNIGRKSNAPHFLAAGKTGGGKTSLIRTLLTEAIPRGVPVAGAIDVKMLELDGFETFPGVASVVYSIREIVGLINAVYAEMMARNAFVHRVRIDEAYLPKFILVLDEFFVMSAFLRRAQSYKGDEPEADALAKLVKNSNPLGKLSEILALIRSAQGRIILGIQRPDARNFGDDAGSVRDNFGARASLSNLSMDGAQMMWDDAHIGRDVDTSVPGRATVADSSGQPMPAQVLWTPNIDDHPNRWDRLSESDQEIVEALREAAVAGAQINADYLPEIRAELERIDGIVPTPGNGPVMACFSEKMRDFLRDRQGSVPERPTAVNGIDPVTAVDEGIRADALTSGTRIYIDDAGRSLLATVVSANKGRGRVRAKLRDETNPKVVHTAEFAPDELLLTADATEESLHAVAAT